MLPYWIKIFTEFYLAIWLRMFKFTEKKYKQIRIFKFQLYKLPLGYMYFDSLMISGI